MEWWMTLIIIFSCLMFLFIIGVPVAFSFLFINIIGVYIFWGGESGLEQLIRSIYRSIASFALLPVPLFILMGEIMFLSGIAQKMMDTLDKWLGRIPGRLSILAIGGGTLFSTLSGSAMAGCAMLGSALVPEMEKRGYKKQMSIGPILGSGGLAIMIPPSALAVLLASLSRNSVGDMLMAIIVPGIIMAFFYAAYVIIRCILQPDLAPSYEVEKVQFFEKIVLTCKYVLPLGLIIFLVIGLMFLGVATPTESAATGALGCFILALIYKGWDWKIMARSISSTLKVTVMMFMIMAGAMAFSQILAFSGASSGMVKLAGNLNMHPMFILIFMQIILLFMGVRDPNVPLEPGFLDVTVRAEDSQGAYALQPYSIYVRDNLPPEILSEPARRAIVGTLYTYDIIANDDDSPHAALEYRIERTGPEPNLPGDMTLDANHRVTWTPGENEVGSYEFVVTVLDEVLAADTQTF
ncbi:MAG: TRAP transporter large permease subunit, partial [Proteobacteria bacterium]|nr:TRAP transporter large permease subunit [Pseudomonadota bacterium]